MFQVGISTLQSLKTGKFGYTDYWIFKRYSLIRDLLLQLIKWDTNPSIKKNNWHHIIANWMTKNICESLLWVFWKLITMRYDVHIRVRTFLKIMKNLYACKRRFSQIWFRLSFVSFLTALSDFYLNLKNSVYTLVQKFKYLPDLRVT